MSPRPDPQLPFVTVAIPCLNEEAYIERCLDGVLGQDYEGDLEVIVGDGGSSDRTREILDEYAQSHPQVRWIDNPRRIQSAAMNEIIRRSRGEIIVRLDAHAKYASDYVRRCVEVLERTGADNVGGAQRASAETSFQRAVCAALRSRVGVGDASYRNEDSEGFVDTVFCGAFRRKVFETVGMYDPCAITNEDAELNQRILDAGGRIYLSRDIVAYYYPRDSYQSLSKQYFKYGMGRARTLLIHKRFPRLRPIIPFLMVLTGGGLVLSRPFAPSTWALFGAYATMTGVEAVRVAWREGPGTTLTTWTIFPLLHVSHGLGFAHGLIRYGFDPDWTAPERLEQDQTMSKRTRLAG
jgi:succinoglycan biosynthesis protein ExoA